MRHQHTNTNIRGVSGEGAEKMIFKNTVVAENFPNLMQSINLHIQEAK